MITQYLENGKYAAVNGERKRHKRDVIMYAESKVLTELRR